MTSKIKRDPDRRSTDRRRVNIPIAFEDRRLGDRRLEIDRRH